MRDALTYPVIVRSSAWTVSELVGSADALNGALWLQSTGSRESQVAATIEPSASTASQASLDDWIQYS